MDKLIEAVCKHEAEMIRTLRLQETSGDNYCRCDIRSRFDEAFGRKAVSNL